MILSSPHLSTRPARIISLVPSLTELLHYLGLEEETIAITKFCIHPAEWFQNKTRIGGTKALDIEKIISLQPDLIIANKEENVKEQVEELAEHFPVWLTDVNNLNDAFEMIRDTGNLTSTLPKAEELITAIKKGFDQLPEVADPVTVAYLIWKDPYMTVGGDTFIHDMIEKAGMKNVFATKKRYPEVTIQQIKGSGCRILLLSSEPYPFTARHITLIQELLPGIKIRLANGEMFSWYGSRLLQSAGYFQTLTAEPVTD